MVLRFYNTLTRKKEVFRPLKKGRVSMYNCGPTVYDYAHIGNFRTYLFADILRRYLEWKGYGVDQVMNITDVGHMTEDDVADAQGEDKIERKARQEKKTPRDIADFYTRAFLEDWRKLNLLEPKSRPKATDYIKQMISVTQELIRKGHAYESNGSVYFHVPSFKNYGKLSGNSVEQLKAGAGGRVEDNPDKRNPLDFALWVHNPRHLMQWDSPWGRGYPGWHIECSAMSMELLGKTIDIHTGGEDNIFPHHDCEIAQSESANKKTFVKYWLHARHLRINGKKMSKSLGNFYRLDDLLKKGFTPETVRYALISGHYRTRLNLTDQSLEDARSTLERLFSFTREMASHRSSGKDNPKADSILRDTRQSFEKAMDDDLGISEALSSVFTMISRVNRERDAGKLSTKDASRVYGLLVDLDRVLGLGLNELPTKESVPDEIRLLVKEREGFRKSRDFRSADMLREQIRKKGYLVEDSPDGPRVRKI